MKALSIITGILTIILGVFAMTMPFRTFLGFGWIFGVLLAVNGVTLSINGFAKGGKGVWQGILGILVGIFGLVMLANGIARFATDMFLTYLIGIGIIISCITLIINSIVNFKENKGRSIVLIICAVLGIILGVAAITHPVLTMVTAGIMIGASIIMQGINFIVYGFDGKKKKADAE